MTGNLKSKLAEASDVVLDSSVKVEACPNKLGANKFYYGSNGHW